MRVCIAYTDGLTPIKGGGVAAVINNIVKFTADKIDYSLLTVYDEDELLEIGRLYPRNVDINYVKPTGSIFESFMRYLVKNVDDFDILHFHNLPLGGDLPFALKTYLRKKSLIYSHHNSLEEFNNNRFARGYYYLCLNQFGRVFKKVVVNSHFIAQNDLARFGVLRDKVCVIRNGVDVEFIKSVEPLDLEGEPSILFVGHLVRRKGIDILLKAFTILSSFGLEAKPKLHIVGSGDLEKSCREYVVDHNLVGKVCFWGSLDETLKTRMMKGADMVVLPSLFENASIAILEAMAAGKAVVATRVGGTPEILEHGTNGILTDPSSIQVAKAIRFLCENKPEREMYGKNNEMAVSPFSWNKIAESYVRLYNSVAK